jgi:hypothetical protein
MKLVRAQHEGRAAPARPEDGNAVALAEEPGHPAADVLRRAAGVLSSPVRAR